MPEQFSAQRMTRGEYLYAQKMFETEPRPPTKKPKKTPHQEQVLQNVEQEKRLKPVKNSNLIMYNPERHNNA